MDIWFVYVIAFLLLGICLYHNKQQRFKPDITQEYKDNKSNGDIGENIVSRKLNLLGDEFKVINDAHIGGTQIDHLVINKSAGIIFVIETKMWGGIITGGYYDKEWMQNKNGEIKYLDNPIAQNRYHCNVVKKRYSSYDVKNVVVFIHGENAPSYKNIIRVNDLVDYINRTTNKMYNRYIMDV